MQGQIYEGEQVQGGRGIRWLMWFRSAFRELYMSCGIPFLVTDTGESQDRMKMSVAYVLKAFSVKKIWLVLEYKHTRPVSNI